METTSFNGKTVYTLSQVAQSIRSMIERTYTGVYYIKAEMIKLNLYPRTGHCYPELVEKEEGKIKTEIRGIIWASNYLRINEEFQRITGEPLKDGITILCLAAIVYSPRYGLSLQIQNIEPVFTLGEMAKSKMETIARLKRERIFDANKRLKMPLLPQRIAVISVETSKGYSDFMIALNGNKRGYRFHTKLFPSLLQGERAIATITDRLMQIARRKEDFDCVVVIRGGGGDVGLNCYDQYDLAQQVATFPLPVISGIGHSTNETVTEMVAFSNKITPTEVAYHLIGYFEDFENKVLDFQSIINERAQTKIKDEKSTLAQIEARMQLLVQKNLAGEKTRFVELQSALRLSGHKILNHRRRILADSRTILTDGARTMLSRENLQLSSLFARLQLSEKQRFTSEQNELRHLEEKLKILHPSHILKRGFSITRLNGKSVTDIAQLSAGDEVETTVLNGKFKSVVEKCPE